ncbi:uncharacterized protein LOC120535815 [Polypterus senegalus]
MDVQLGSFLAAPRGNWLFLTGTISSFEAMGRSKLLLLLALCILNSSQATDFKYMGSSLSLEVSTGKAIPELIVYYRSLALSPCPPVTQGMCQVLNCTSVAQQSSTEYSGWCHNHGQAVIPMSNSSTLQIRPTGCCWLPADGLKFSLPMSVELGIRSDTQNPNHLPQAGISQPIRVPQNCLTVYNLNVFDPDKDVVRCRFGNQNEGECTNCSQYSFLQLDEVNCVLNYTGSEHKGIYIVELIIEDFPVVDIVLSSNYGNRTIPAYSPSFGTSARLSATPLQFTITVDEAALECNPGLIRPAFVAPTPPSMHIFPLMPYDGVSFTISAVTSQTRISNFTILGPPGLQNSLLWFNKRQDFDITSANVSWTRITVYQPIYISVCFSANIDRFQSVPWCIWIQQIPAAAPPPGSAIQCLETEMKFILARTTLPNIYEHDLQLNDPSCNITGNATHFLLDIPLLGCGTKIQVEDAYFVFINTLMTRTLYGVITRLPTLRLPITCHYQSMDHVGNNMTVSTYVSDKAFGNFSIHIEFKQSSLSRSRTGLIQSPLRVASNEILYLYVFANTPVPKVDLIVQSCWTSQDNNATTGTTFIKQGCVNEGIVQLVSDESLEKIYKINLGAILNSVSEVYVQCIVQLCINIDSTTNCSSGCLSSRTVQYNPMSREYHVSSGLISLVQSSTVGATTSLVSSPSTQLAASYVAIITGTVIGCTVTLVVALLVMKSFQGVTNRRIHHLVRDHFSSSGSWKPQQFTNI